MAKRKPIQTKKKQYYIRPTVVILGDGETEEAYINRIKELQLFSNVYLKFEKGNELNFETKIKEHAENQNVLVILDIDNVQSGSFKYREIYRLTNTKKYKDQVYYNNYSFETWLLNHKIYFAKPITNQSQYNKEMFNQFKIKSWHVNKNHKNRESVVNLISIEEISFAVMNVKKMNKKTPFANPSSNMDNLINYI